MERTINSLNRGMKKHSSYNLIVYFQRHTDCQNRNRKAFPKPADAGYGFSAQNLNKFIHRDFLIFPVDSL
jgi:hypothetical protein